MGDSRPVGVFDSGVGGLTVLHQLRRLLPGERLLYLADLEWFPYGPRPLPEVRRRALDIVDYLAQRDTKLVVIACNSATAAALNAARERFDIPVVGVIAPGAEAAVAATRNGRIAVISTQATMDSREYVHAMRESNPGVVVLGVAAPDLVDIVESGGADTERADAALGAVLREVTDWGADTLVLGCTHYPLLIGALRRVLAERPMTIVDSAATTAARVKRILGVNHLQSGARRTEAPQLMVTASPQRFLETARRIFGESLDEPEIVDIHPPQQLVVAG